MNICVLFQITFQGARNELNPTQQGHATQETDIRKMKCDAVMEGEEGSWQVLVKCPSPQGTAELSSAPTKRDDISTVSCDVSAVQSSVSCDMSAVQSSSPSLQSPYVEGDVYSINTHVAQISAAISSRPMQVGHATSGLLLALFFSIWPDFFSPLFLFTF